MAVSARVGAVLCIDHGTRKSGFALADALRIAVRPLETWRGAGDSPALLEHVARLCDEWDVAAVVVGWPTGAGGAEAPRTAEVRSFCRRLAQRMPRIVPWIHDEHLSTKAAEDLLREAGIPRGQHRALRDSWSALVILRDWIASGEPHRTAPDPPTMG